MITARTLFRKKSVILIFISICTLLIVGSSLIYNIYLTTMTEMYPSVVNNLGVVRGTAQKLVKAETNGIVDDASIQKLDLIFADFNSRKIDMYNKHSSLRTLVAELNHTWEELKFHIVSFRKEPTAENRILLLSKSEEFWTISNSAVFLSQGIAEDAIKNNRILYFLSSANIIIVLIIIIMVKRYVHDNLEYAARHDSLTGLYNRAHFYGRLKSTVERSRKGGRVIAIILYDIDHFKRVNDTYGHDVGDDVLRELSALSVAVIRENEAVLARVGGEEFAILLEGSDAAPARIIAERIRQKVETHTFAAVGSITISLGVAAMIPEDTIDTLVKRADEALYEAKRKGRNRTEVYHPGINSTDS